MNLLGDRVREAMELVGMSLNELDRRIGRSQGYTSRLVNPTPGMKPRDPRGESITAIAEALNVRPEWLLTGDLPMRPTTVAAPGSRLEDARSRAEQILRLEDEYTEAEILDGSARAAEALRNGPERSAREWRNEIDLEIRAARRTRTPASNAARPKRSRGSKSSAR